jgi:hypothetical protein
MRVINFIEQAKATSIERNETIRPGSSVSSFGRGLNRTNFFLTERLLSTSFHIRVGKSDGPSRCGRNCYRIVQRCGAGETIPARVEEDL